MTVKARIEWISDVERIHALEQPWRELQVRVRDRTPVSGFDYAEAWYRHYGGAGHEHYGRPLVGAAWRGTDLVGIAPWTVWHGTLGMVPVSRIDFAGFNAQGGEFLIDPEHPELVGRFVESVCAESRFDVMVLHGCRPNGPRLRLIEDVASSCKMSHEESPYRFAVVGLENGFEVYRRSMSKNFRRNMKRIERRVEDVGAPRIDRLAPRDGARELPQYIERMFSIADSSWKVRVSGPMARHHREFYRETMERHAQRGQLDFSILVIGGNDAAFLAGIVQRRELFDLTISFADEFAAVSPGVYLMLRLLREMKDSGIERVVSYGDHEYKRRWASGFESRVKLYLFRGVRGGLSRFAKFKVEPHIPGHRQAS